MSRLIVRYRGEGPRPESTITQLRSLPDVSIIDDSGRMLLIDGPEAMVRDALRPSDDWIIAPEKKYSIPDVRKKVERPPH